VLSISKIDVDMLVRIRLFIVYFFCMYIYETPQVLQVTWLRVDDVINKYPEVAF